MPRTMGFVLVICVLMLTAGPAMAETVTINGVQTETPTQGNLPGESVPGDGVIPELDEVLIDFDDLDAPTTFSSAEPLTDEYTDMGVTFTGQGEVLHEDGNFGISGHSSPNFLAFNTGAGVSPPETMLFDPPVSMVTIGAAHSNSFTISMTAFDENGNEIESVSMTGSSVMSELSITSDEDIYSVVLDFTGSVCCFDNLVFEQNLEPDPVEFHLYPTTDVIPPNGGTVVYDVELVSQLNQSFPGVVFWTIVTIPNGQEFGPLVQIPFTLTPFMDAFVVGATQDVPGLAPSGVYTFTGYVGYQAGPYLEDEFEFEKLGTATDGVEGWNATMPLREAIGQ